MTATSRQRRWSKGKLCGLPAVGRVWRTVLLTGVTMVALGVTASGAAAHGHRAGTFSCKGTGATLLTLTFAVSNPMDSPCKTEHASIAFVSGKPSLKVTAQAVESETNTVPRLLKKRAKAGDRAGADAKVAKAIIGAVPGHNVKVRAISSEVTEGCVKSGSGLKLVRKGKSSVAGLKIDGKKMPIITTPEKIPLGPLATIWLNRTIKTKHSLTQRAVQIDLAGKVAVILAQSQADFTGRPCSNS
ncbi:MAG TPA: choice-of-anchor P family protein [Solirubrobacteraceae bacterium]|nr:choice-of-anchor P family protein [Solirubrobacteraceae bacterium]